MTTARKGTMTDTTAIVGMADMRLPATITLKFAVLSTQKIELSTDDGTEYFEPTYDEESATMKVVSIAAPISHVKFTGVVGNTWRIR